MTSTLKEYLFRKLPPGSQEYCFELWQEYPFRLKISKQRVSKSGDYRFDPRKKDGGGHLITINDNLNPYSFLITFIHEVAHRTSYEIYGNHIGPHGKEWKSEFKRLMKPMLSSRVFPDSIHTALEKHMVNPKATSYSDPKLVKGLAKYDIDSGGVQLIDLNPGDQFTFRKKEYVKLEKRRTRIVCMEVISKRKYLIPGVAEVTKTGKD